MQSTSKKLVDQPSFNFKSEKDLTIYNTSNFISTKHQDDFSRTTPAQRNEVTTGATTTNTHNQLLAPEDDLGKAHQYMLQDNPNMSNQNGLFQFQHFSPYQKQHSLAKKTPNIMLETTNTSSVPMNKFNIFNPNQSFLKKNPYNGPNHAKGSVAGRKSEVMDFQPALLHQKYPGTHHEGPQFGVVPRENSQRSLGANPNDKNDKGAETQGANNLSLLNANKLGAFKQSEESGAAHLGQQQPFLFHMRRNS